MLLAVIKKCLCPSPFEAYSIGLIKDVSWKNLHIIKQALDMVWVHEHRPVQIQQCLMIYVTDMVISPAIMEHIHWLHFYEI